MKIANINTKSNQLVLGDPEWLGSISEAIANPWLQVGNTFEYKGVIYPNQTIEFISERTSNVAGLVVRKCMVKLIYSNFCHQ